MVQDIHDDDLAAWSGTGAPADGEVRNGLVFDAAWCCRATSETSRVIDSHPDLQFVLDIAAKPRLAPARLRFGAAISRCC